MNLEPIGKWKWNEHWNRSIQEAISEIEREIQVRLRCMDRWISEGKVSRVDAWDRTERIISAVQYLRRLEGILGLEGDTIAEGDHPPAITAEFRADEKGIVDVLDRNQASN